MSKKRPARDNDNEDEKPKAKRARTGKKNKGKNEQNGNAMTDEDNKASGKDEKEAKEAVPALDVFEDKDYLQFLTEEAMAWANTHGLVMGNKADEKRLTILHCPITLLPSKIHKPAFEHAKSLAQDFNVLVDSVSRNYEFLYKTLEASAKADDFIKRLLHILKTTHDEGVAQPLCLGLHRSDYMFHSDTDADGKVKDPIPLQVEINTISAAFGSLTTLTTQLHKFIISRHSPNGFPFVSYVPDNKAVTNIAKALATAVKKHPHDKQVRAVVMMLVQPGETNSADQRLVEHTLWEDHHIPMIRRTLGDVAERGKTDKDGNITIDGHTVAVAYFRAGYQPKDYPTEKEWEAVLTIERSKTIKCPSVAYHLAGTKKVQQAVAAPGVLEKFVDGETAARLRTCFAGLWGLEGEDAETKAIIEKAIKDPHEYVLKPQREGGGNNIWGENISKLLSTATPEERGAYILMQRIKPVIHKAAMMRNGQLIVAPAASELGIFSGFLGDGKKVHFNVYNGHLLRTKAEGTDEGGVAAGFAVLDSPYLV